MSCSEFEALLDPYFDGELPVPDALATERHLSECAACRDRYERMRWLRAEIRSAELDYEPPATLVRKARALGRSGAQRRAWWWGAALAAAAAVVLLVGPRLFAGPDRAGSEILDSHLRSLLAASLVDVPSSDRHTVKPWFQGRIGFAPDVPDLSRDGFVLVGGRVEVIGGQRAAALVYKRREHVINLFLTEARGSGAERSSQAQGYNLIAWTDHGLSHWAVSDLDARELSRFAQLIRNAP